MADVDLSTLGSVIKAAYEGEADTNAVTDAEKTVLGNTSGVNTGDQAITPEGTAVLSTGETGGTKFLREDGDNTCSWQSVPVGSGDLKADGTVPLSANWDIGAFTITGTQFISDIATGTAPFVVASTTQVANLNAATAGNADTVTTNADLTGVVTSSGNATAIADKALAIAKLADGTDGELITWDAAGVITTVPVGTATHVLTSNGVGVAPTFQPAAGGGGGWDVEDTTNGNYGHGLNALDSISVGSGLDNIAIGENAGTALTTGDRCIFIGTSAGQTQSTAGSSIGIGYNALKSASSNSNVAIGTEAAQALNTFDDFNVAIGSQSLYLANNCDNAVAIGYFAMGGSGVTGSDSVAIGYGAGSKCVRRNVYIGASVASFCTGSDNVFIGESCATTAVGVDFSVMIGSSVVAPSTTLDDQFVIGNGTHNAIEGYFGARSDLDYSAKDLTITGPSAFASASTNQDGGNLVLQGGQKATGGGTSGKVVISDVLNVADAYTVSALPTGAVGDVCRITDGDAALAWGATAVNSGAGATPYMVWYNGTNWTVMGI